MEVGKIKIIRLVSELNYGGVEKRLENISRVKDLNEWVFCALGKGGAAEEAIKKNNCRVVLLNKKYRIPNLSVLFALVSFFKKETIQLEFFFDKSKTYL